MAIKKQTEGTGKKYQSGMISKWEGTIWSNQVYLDGEHSVNNYVYDGLFLFETYHKIQVCIHMILFSTNR